ncbi:PREDICTED: epidermal growth factor receptor substrate 15-like 1 [Dipodomys ordii]|uniref:Epidermal growth factor receptor substrate 15-like 1 n=1 Tax=Dipodomys ordii TaxID=10020 RepID=A0A1S3G4K9_DIPOR|nr:PREDICTED: epidermal growth factor receptor substrate 15-like 1 [Dipodomys ordii]
MLEELAPRGAGAAQKPSKSVIRLAKLLAAVNLTPGSQAASQLAPVLKTRTHGTARVLHRLLQAQFRSHYQLLGDGLAQPGECWHPVLLYPSGSLLTSGRGAVCCQSASQEVADAVILPPRPSAPQPIPSGNPLYESYYKQVDPAYTGRVGASEAALFLKKSGLSDITLGKIWDLADPEGKGFLDKQGFYVALRLVACAQSGHEVALSNLSLTMPPPKFHDTSSPLMATPPPAETHWAVRVEEKAKFDGIFESLLPINGLLSGDKVKPVLMNSKLPLDVLGRVWDLSDIDKDGHLDRDEFAVAMHLVYRALEKEPVPSALPPALIPPSKRKKAVFPGAVPVLPASPPPKDSLRSTPSHGSVSSLNSAGSLSPKHGVKQPQVTRRQACPSTRGWTRGLGLPSGRSAAAGRVSGEGLASLPAAPGLHLLVLRHFWALADTRQTGKLSKDQFALAMYFIQQKVSKGVDPPQVLSPDMVPPSERGAPLPDSSSSLGPGEFTGVKELDDISQEIAQLQREKFSLEQDIREKEEAIRQKTSEVQELQNDLDRETSSLQELEAQKQDAQERLDEMDQQKAKLRDMLSDIRQKCQDETQMISSLKTQIQSQESDLRSQEEDLSRARAELTRLQQEETQLEQSVQAGRAQLDTIIKSLQSTQDEISQARSALAQLQESRVEAQRGVARCERALDGAGLAAPADGGGFGAMDDPFKSKALLFSGGAQELPADPFQADDPFQTDPFKGADPFKGDPFQNDPFVEQQTAITDPFGGDPFRESDPFRGPAPEPFSKKQPRSDPFAADPFAKTPGAPTSLDPFEASEPFASSGVSKASDPFGTLDPFGSGAFGSTEGFADFSQMSKPPPGPFPASVGGAAFSDDPFHGAQHTPALPPKKPAPPRPKPPSEAEAPESGPRYTLLAGTFPRLLARMRTDCGQPVPADCACASGVCCVLRAPRSLPLVFTQPRGQAGAGAVRDEAGPAPALELGAGRWVAAGVPHSGPLDIKFCNEEQQLAWAKRESAKAEQERLARLRRQEQEDLELAIALSKADMPA